MRSKPDDEEFALTIGPASENKFELKRPLLPDFHQASGDRCA